jgi:monoterpene epsilon-lactone hydrolase
MISVMDGLPFLKGNKDESQTVAHFYQEETRMTSPEALKLEEILRNAPKAVDMDLPHQREAGEHAEDMTSEPEGVRFEDAPAVGGLWATPRSWDGETAIMYLYGGGYVISSPHSRRKLAGHLANASGARALVPRYHLAPERPFPSAVDDAAADYRWLLGEGYRSERVVISGDSSAGGLTVAAMLKLRGDDAALPAGGVPISPWVDLACTGETLETNATADLTATKASLMRMAGEYLDGSDPRTPLASPLYADLSGLPPLLVVVGGAEALLDDSVRLARLAGIAGVDVTLYIGARMQHIFPIYCGAIPEADAAVAMIGAWIRSRAS